MPKQSALWSVSASHAMRGNIAVCYSQESSWARCRTVCNNKRSKYELVAARRVAVWKSPRTVRSQSVCLHIRTGRALSSIIVNIKWIIISTILIYSLCQLWYSCFIYIFIWYRIFTEIKFYYNFGCIIGTKQVSFMSEWKFFPLQYVQVLSFQALQSRSSPIAYLSCATGAA
jgi:hypothetical protein